MDSILDTIKKLLGIAKDYTRFDTDIIVHINTSMMLLNQLGIGPPEGFSITGPEQTWLSYIPTGKNLEAVKTLIYLRTRLAFDPPANSFVVDSFQKQIEEYQWRLQVQAENGGYVYE